MGRSKHSGPATILKQIGKALFGTGAAAKAGEKLKGRKKKVDEAIKKAGG